MWGPTGYDHVEYYYLPEMEVYYNVPQRRFIYLQGGYWISASSLPSRYRGYNLYNAYKVVVNEPRPYRNHQEYRERYSYFKGRHSQQVIRDSRDSRYFINQDHPQHKTWEREQRQERPNGNGKPHGNDKPHGNTPEGH
jgi:hypothetical protein